MICYKPLISYTATVQSLHGVILQLFLPQLVNISTICANLHLQLIAVTLRTFVQETIVNYPNFGQLLSYYKILTVIVVCCWLQ